MNITLRQGHASPTTIVLRTVAVAMALAGTTIYLRSASPATGIVLRSPVAVPSGGGGFPTQYSGLRYFSGTVRELSLVALADAPAGMGGQWRVRKGGTDYAVYLVETTDPNASGVRIRTSTGVKAARIKT
jgi:hypothetical protein